MKKLKIFCLSLFVSINLIVFMVPVRALACDLTPGGGVGSFMSFPTWYQHLDGEIVAGKCTPVINAGADTVPIVVAIVEIMLRIIGLATIAFIVYGGFKYVTSQGQPDSTAQARHTIQNALIGFVISLIAAVAVRFIGNNIS